MVTVPYQLTDGDGNVWAIDAYGNVSSGPISTGGSNGYTVYDADPTLSRGQRQLTFGPQTDYLNVEISRKVYVSEDDAFVRFLDSYTNTSETTVTETVYLNTTGATLYASDLARSSDGDTSDLNDDGWAVFDDTTDAEPAVAIVTTGLGGLAPNTQTGDYGSFDSSFTFQLAPGETKSLVHFLAVGDSASDAARSAASLASLDDDALAGLSDDELRTIENFGPPKSVYNGTKADNVIRASFYDERLNGKGGDDRLYAGDGNDTLNGGSGNDRLYGQDGNDEAAGGPGADRIYGGDGSDYLVGDADNSATTSATVTIPSTGEQISISLTLPDEAAGTTVSAEGYISRTPVTSNTFNLAFVMDMSGSTSSGFVGDVDVGDQNGDGSGNTVLDAEIAGYVALLSGITAQVGAANVNVSVIAFDDTVRTFGTARANVDTDGDGVSDVVQALRSAYPNGGTTFSEGLRAAKDYFDGAGAGQNIVFFLSDGENNGGEYTDQVRDLISSSGPDATIRAYGVGQYASQSNLDLVDDTIANDSAPIVLDPSDLANVLIDPGIDQTDVDRVELYVNGDLEVTIDGADLQETPLGLSYGFATELTGLKAHADDRITARVYASDADGTVLRTTQIIQDPDATTYGSDRLYGGAGADDLHGNDGRDRLHGGDDDDTLWGGAGADRLYGEKGNDLLNGGDGKDAFVFTVTPRGAHADDIADFDVDEDSIWLDGEAFDGIGRAGELASRAFRLGTEAEDASDRIIYDADTGNLYFDEDGTGSARQYRVATLAEGLDLSADNFLVI